ncbi:MAG TPA: gamma-glutamyltransferase [Gemmatimonadaceae bacterium]|nr:gamma-glutamyltransferase [Gemmatimonadaceae bacterium]
MISFTRPLRIAALAALTLGAACHPSHVAPPAPAPALATPPAIPARQPATFPSGWRFQPGRKGTVAPHAMIASNSALASQAGIEILKEGGNAVDAAVATGFALAVTFPAAGNIGGGGFMVIRMADGRSAALDYREMAPLAATRNMYLDSTGKLTNKSLIGPLASGVPGSVAGMAEALRKYGRMSLHEVMQPAIRLASEGFTVDSALWRSLRGDSARITRFAGAAVFFPDGHPLAPGTKLVQPALARTLQLIAEKGPAAFYRGAVADSIVAEMQRDGGIITKQDLARYAPHWRDPVRGSYRGYQVIAMPPASSGGITTVETLNILQATGPLPPFGSAEYDHLVTEAFRRAFIDRNTKLGDPDFVTVPMAQLTSMSYARTQAATIDRAHATRTPTFGSATPEPMHTTHYSVADAMGNAVATTTTINSLYGSGVYVAGAGFFLNNEMDDFASEPGKPNQFGLVQGEVNAIAPGKRMLSAMSPTIVLDPKGQLLLVVGAAGGPTIITATTQVILNVIDGRMSLGDAMAAPRIHNQAWPDQLRYERGGLSQAVMDSLTAMGHHLHAVRSLANANAVMRAPAGYEGVVEPRSTGGAVGY